MTLEDHERVDALVAAKDSEIARWTDYAATLETEREAKDREIAALREALKDAQHRLRGAGMLGSDEARADDVKGSPAPWPPGDCHDARSCAEHGECMYVGCPHSKCKLPAPDPAEAMRARCEAIIRDNCITDTPTGKQFRPRRHNDEHGLFYADAIAALKGNGEGK